MRKKTRSAVGATHAVFPNPLAPFASGEGPAFCFLLSAFCFLLFHFHFSLFPFHFSSSPSPPAESNNTPSTPLSLHPTTSRTVDCGDIRVSMASKTGKSRPIGKLRTSADYRLVEKARKAFSAFRGEPYKKPFVPELGFCFIRTTLGVLQIDVGWLLTLVGGIADPSQTKTERGTTEVQLTDDALEAALEVVRSIDRYIQRDLLGMFFEAEFVINRKRIKHALPIDKPYTLNKVVEFLLSSQERRRIAGWEALAGLLNEPSVPVLLVPGVIEALVAAISERDVPRWRQFVSRYFGAQQKPGRRAEKLYDVLFARKMENPALSYGKLALEVAKAKNIEFTVAREQVKAAIAYRRKKAEQFRTRPAKKLQLGDIRK
jgi:hypothetical protein